MLDEKSPNDLKIRELLELSSLKIDTITAISEQKYKSFVKKKKKESIIGSLFTNLDNISNHIRQHEESIIWFLGHRLSTVTRKLEILCLEKSFSERVVSRITATTKDITKRKDLDEDNEFVRRRRNVKVGEEASNDFIKKLGIPPSQLQELVNKNEAIIKEYEEMKTHIDKTESSIFDISKLQSTLEEQLIYQNNRVDSLLDDASNSLHLISNANKNLNSAGKKQSMSIKFVFIVLLLCSFLLLIFDWIG